jgi:TolA-binding protein
MGQSTMGTTGQELVTPPADPAAQPAPATPPVAAPAPAPAPVASGTQPAVPPATGLPAELPEDESTLPKWVRDLRKEAAERRTYATGLEEQVTKLDSELRELKEKDLTEEQKKLTRAEETLDVILPKLSTENKQLKVQLRAREFGIIDPEAAVALLDWKAIDAGTSVDDALAALVEKKPYLKAANAAPPPADPVANGNGVPRVPPTNPPGGGSGTVQYTKAVVENMSPDEIIEAMEKGGLRDQLRAGTVR